MQAIKNYSEETITVIEMLESLPKQGREYIVNNIREMLSEVKSEKKWNYLFEKHPEPMIKMGKEAIKAYNNRKTESLKNFLQ